MKLSDQIIIIRKSNLLNRKSLEFIPNKNYSLFTTQPILLKEKFWKEYIDIKKTIIPEYEKKINMFLHFLNRSNFSDYKGKV